MKTVQKNQLEAKMPRTSRMRATPITRKTW